VRPERRADLQLTSFKGPSVGTPRWSPDGRWIAFDSRGGGRSDISVIAADGGAPRRLMSELSDVKMPAWSHDGKWIYFVFDRSGSEQLWKMPALGGAPAQLTRGGSWEGLPSPDGKLVYFVRRDGGGIWSVPVEGGAEKPVQGLEKAVRISRCWGVLKEGIYFRGVSA